MNYSDIILNIREAKTPFEILDNVDNLKWLLEREKYKNGKSNVKDIKE